MTRHARHPDVHWKVTAASRNVVGHDYPALDLCIIWDVADRGVPPLRSQTERILECLTGGEQ